MATLVRIQLSPPLQSQGTSVVDRRAHNPEDGGSNPSPATILPQ
jgi:hypothetical protein